MISFVDSERKKHLESFFIKNEKENLIVRLTFEFSIQIIKYSEELEAFRKFAISNQLLKSGTSIGANVWEAQNAESPADFIHKFKIAAKEVEETEYWLLLCEFSENLPSTQALIQKLAEIKKIISKIIITTKNKKKAGNG